MEGAVVARRSVVCGRGNEGSEWGGGFMVFLYTAVVVLMMFVWVFLCMFV